MIYPVDVIVIIQNALLDACVYWTVCHSIVNNMFRFRFKVLKVTIKKTLQTTGVSLLCLLIYTKPADCIFKVNDTILIAK